MNREEWLINAVDHIADKFFQKRGCKLPAKISVSCGFPKGPSTVIGQCWDPVVCEDGTTHIFICPSLGKSVEVLGILTHELIHASVGVHNGHNHIFSRRAKNLGLVGPATQATAKPGTDTWKVLEKISGKLGDYPHSAMNNMMRKKKNKSPRRLTIISKNDGAYRVSVLEELLLKSGFPTDPWGDKMVLKN